MKVAMMTVTVMAPPCFYLPITTRLPPFHVLLLFYNCDPFITLPLPLLSFLSFLNPAVSSLLIGAYPYWPIV